MPTTKAQQRAVNKYMKENYDRVNLTLPKGQKDRVKARADAAGESVNAYIARAIEERMEREGEASKSTRLSAVSTAPARAA